MSNYNITVTSASGVERLTAKELVSLGFPNPKAIDGKFDITGNDTQIARLNMFLRTGERVYIKLTEFFANTFDELFDGANNFPWDDYLPEDAKIVINGKSKKSTLYALSSCQKIIKKAILVKLGKCYHTNVFHENGALYEIVFSISDNKVCLYLNTSGEALHKRGYRDLVGEAPIKETLASAMLMLSDFSADRPFIDPFCGSGTIVIEAALMAQNIAAGKLRNFAYQDFSFLDKTIYENVITEASDTEKRSELRFYGFDIDPAAIKLAMRHAERAGISADVHLQVQDVAELKNRYKGGCIVTNPPYGERLLSMKDAENLYKTFGNVYRNLDNWSAFIITSAPRFERFFGRISDKNRKFYNANLECRLYQYFKKQD